MDLLSQLALAGGLAWASGIRLYATLFIIGLLARFGYLHLPEQLMVLQHTWVLMASGIMVFGEFLADKVPGFDSVWDAVHTFIRIPAGAFLAWGAMGDATPAAQMAAAINTSPEPVSNWTASFGEDGLVLGGLFLAISHPLAFLVLLVLFLALVVWLLPKVFRYLARIFRQLTDRNGDSLPSP